MLCYSMTYANVIQYQIRTVSSSPSWLALQLEPAHYCTVWYQVVVIRRDWKIVITGTGYLIPSVLYRSTTVICQYNGDRILR